MTESSNIAAALAAFQAEMPVVVKGKTAKVPTKAGGSYSYTYADIADVTAAAMPVLTKHGLAFSACPRRTDQGGYELVGTLLHSSGETLQGALPIHGHQAQEIGSSLTYNRRYLLGCMTGLVTEDDDDGALARGAQERRAQEAEDRTAAELEVQAAWVEHRGAWDFEAMCHDFESLSRGRKTIDSATAADLRKYAGTLKKKRAERIPAGKVPTDDEWTTGATS